MMPTPVLEPTASEVTWARRAARHIARRLGEEAAGVLPPAPAGVVYLDPPLTLLELQGPGLDVGRVVKEGIP